jgi:transposase
MFYAGIDAHTKSSTICVVDGKGRKVSSSTVVTSAEGFAAGVGRWARRGLKAAVEASGITPWICQLLKDLKVKVVVVNPNRIRLIAESRKKSDRVDAESLAELLRLGGLPEVHQPSLGGASSAYGAERASATGAPANGVDQPSPGFTAGVGRYSAGTIFSRPGGM